ncbi:Rne/Rng family ribonuclease [Kribbella sp. NBC_01245]|uniref:Rne/Rng family ribonuclease n=1 Tax=Kribbella sp. NBC_01245 TaxID=2903578 RepID=UPI002E2D2150|nr:Rne/Rng family ribonuclease [Kribbella sp. NBC_01245]
MLENEPTTTNESATDQGSGQSGTSSRPARKRTTKSAAGQTATKRTAAKRTTKKAAAQSADAPETQISTQSDGASADPAPAPAKRAAAKKTAAKRTAKKAAAPVETAQLETAPEPVAEPVAEAAAPVKRTTRKRTTKKTAAPQPDLLSADSPVTDGPTADTETASTSTEAEAEVKSSRRTRTRSNRGAKTAEALEAAGATETAEAAPAPVVETPAEPALETTDATESTRRTRRRAPAVAAVLFQPPVADAPAPKAAQTSRSQKAQPAKVDETPEVEAAPTTNRRRRTRGAAVVEETVAETPAVEAETETDAGNEPAAREGSRRSRRSRSRRGGQVEETPVVAEEDETEDEDTEESAELEETDAEDETESDDENEETEASEGEGTRRRRRRRGGRRRRKNGDAEGSDDSDDTDSTEGEQDNQDDNADDTEAQADEDGEDGEGGSSSRRRRRRRRRKGEDAAAAPDDPEEIVVRVREPRSKNTANEITAIEGSTRMEAKKQRRREGRAAGRRRAPIVTEAEFLARRESVDRTMVIRARDDLTQIAVSEDNVLVEHYVAQAEQSSLIGNVYLGRVQNVLPSMEAAFIDIGKGRNAVLYAGEVDWATLGAGNGPRKIEAVLKSGQAVLVQVTKDPIGHKGARLTNQISLPGRYVVYVPRGGNGGISRKLPDTERNRLKGILKDIVPDEAGVIVRTAAEGASEEELTADVSRLKAYWDDIEKKSKSGQAPQMLYGEPDLLIRVVRDLFTEDFAKLVISGDDAFDMVSEYVSGVAPHLADRVEKWSPDSGDAFANYRIDEQIKKALDRKVWLPSGGSLVIDRTEAMTVVDVNTGKFTGSGGNLEETVTRNNLEAAEEIVRQLRLRDIGGIIVVDFIDMVLESNRDLVLRRLVECLGRDRTKHQVAEVTSLGLVQMTRKRIGTGLLEAFGENCDHCGGRGLILHDEPKDAKKRSEPAAAAPAGGGRGQQNGQAAPGGTAPEEGAKKSSRRGRGRGKGKQETEAEQPEQSGDAAQRLAEIAAATGVDKAANGTSANAEELAVAPV